MNDEDFRRWGRRAVEWSADYRSKLRERPVRPNIEPGTIARQLPSAAPEAGEPMEAIFADFERLIVPGMTHWQHPRFFAYFPANAAPVSVIAEMLTAAIGAQCMLWQTSPAATELEQVVVGWLAAALGLPPAFKGVIQDSASSATFSAVLTMRERALGFAGNRDGLAGGPAVRIYSSAEVHSSVDKAVRMAGIGAANHVKVPVGGPLRAMQPAALAAAITADRAAGLSRPASSRRSVAPASAPPTTSLPLPPSPPRENLYLHVDAAWAGRR